MKHINKMTHALPWLGFLAIAISVVIVREAAEFAPAPTKASKRLVYRIHHTPFNSPIQDDILREAVSDNLLGLAYVEYTAIWNKNQADPYVNFLRGRMAANLVMETAFDPPSSRKYTPEQFQRLQSAANDCLSRAYAAKPDYPPIDVTYASWIFIVPGRQQQAVSLVRKAVRARPNNALYWAVLGEELMNPSPATCNQTEAASCLRKSERLDPKSPVPHIRFVQLYLDEKRYAEARKELAIFSKMVGPTRAKWWNDSYHPFLYEGPAAKHS